MAGNTVYVQGNYVDVHDNEVVNLNIDKATVSLRDGIPTAAAPAAEVQGQPDGMLAPQREAMLQRLLALADKGDWAQGVAADDIKAMLRDALGAGKPLSDGQKALSEQLWRLLEQGSGDRVRVVWQNLAGLMLDRGLLAQKGAPAINRDFFDTADGYSNIDKGRPSRNNMSTGFREVLPLLEACLPPQKKRPQTII